MQGIVCKRCEVIVYDLNKLNVTADAKEKAANYGIQSVPSIVVDGKQEDIELLKKNNLLHQWFRKKAVDQ
ncbi:hypothetical protein [Paenibacillus sp. GXUN7292]|uniref:hypothetical protein n=1 Tax=Paenibacillus sp. GXUN7292 TaxID=3422499 RepID=UPI003D7E2ED8